MKSLNQNRLRVAAIILLIAVGINALAAGYGFITDPTGRGLGMSVGYLQYSPFNDFLIPGIVLFICNGVLDIIAVILTARRSRFFPGMILFQGYFLIVWIIVQATMARDFNLLHFTCLVIGIALMLIGRKLLHSYYTQVAR